MKDTTFDKKPFIFVHSPIKSKMNVYRCAMNGQNIKNRINKPENPFQNHDVAKNIHRSPNWLQDEILTKP